MLSCLISHRAKVGKRRRGNIMHPYADDGSPDVGYPYGAAGAVPRQEGKRMPDLSHVVEALRAARPRRAGAK